MKILLGTHYLAKTGGTESYTYALALELKRLGHHVEYFAIVRGNEFISEMHKYSPQLAAWSRAFAIQNLNIEQAVDKYLSICDNIDYKRQYCKLKLDLFDMKAKYQQALDVNIDIKSGLKSQLTNHQQESANIIASYRTKGQKHLKVIRFLLWLCIVLSIIILLIVFVG